MRHLEILRTLYLIINTQNSKLMVLGTPREVSSVSPGERVRKREKALKIARRFRKVCERKNLCRFWTFTFFWFLSNEERMQRWNAFKTALRYYYPNIEYLGVKEIHPGTGLNGGKIHLHLLLSEYIPWELVQRLWEQSGAGKIVQVKKVSSVKIVGYICKYLYKDIESGIISRPVVSSREFCLNTSDFLAWSLKLASWGDTAMLQWILDNVDFKKYHEVAGLRKRRAIARIYNIAVSLAL